MKSLLEKIKVQNGTLNDYCYYDYNYNTFIPIQELNQTNDIESGNIKEQMESEKQRYWYDNNNNYNSVIVRVVVVIV